MNITPRMKKIGLKLTSHHHGMSITMPIEIVDGFEEFCKKHQLGKSRVIAELVQQFMNANGETK